MSDSSCIAVPTTVFRIEGDLRRIDCARLHRHEEGEETQGEPEWRPQNEEELLDAIAEKDYGVSDDCSSALTAPALKAYNNALKSEYGHYELRRGRTLPEGFVIVKVTADMATCRVLCNLLHDPLP